MTTYLCAALIRKNPSSFKACILSFSDGEANNLKTVLQIKINLLLINVDNIIMIRQISQEKSLFIPFWDQIDIPVKSVQNSFFCCYCVIKLYIGSFI